jgi:hypothetical protein
MKKILIAIAVLTAISAGTAVMVVMLATSASFEAEASGDCVSAPGNLPGVVPQPYNSTFTAASEQYKIDPALEASIFESEHSNTWPDPDGPWASSASGASGPLQFMPGTWAGYSGSNPQHPNGNIQSLTDSSFAAAHLLADLGGKVNMPPGDPLSPEKGTVAWVSGAYNGPGRPLVGNGQNDKYRANAVAKYLEFKGSSFVAAPAVVTTPMPSGAVPNNTCVALPGGAQAFGGRVIKARLDSAGQWPVPMPDFPGETIDPRILGNAQMLAKKFHMLATDCFGPHPPHAANGEHPVAAACDYVPSDGSWNSTMAAARAVGWNESCAANGCEGTVKAPFRSVYYNGYPGHGDPAHCSGSCPPHIHFSWLRAPGPPGQPPTWIECFVDAYCRP